METAEILCEKRETHAKGEIRALRRSGRIPAVVYGPKSPACPVTLTQSELRARLSTNARQPVLKLKSSAPELNDKHVIFKDLQRSPISGHVLHVDLYEVDLAQRLKVSVPLRFLGKAKGVADGGILQPLERDVEVECFPLEIPEFVEVDVSTLGIHDVIHVSALKFSGNVRPIFDADFPVVTVLPPTIEEAPVAAAGAVEAATEAAAPETVAPAEASETQATGKKPESAKK